jgi:hypothetical protein
MPGTRLSQAETSLISDWQRGNYRYPHLAALEIGGAGGLRGIRALTLSCDRPITAICGPSGAGKSTLLELCALAFRAKGSPAPDQITTAFDQHFVTIAGEAPFSDFAVTWSYRADTLPPVTLRGADRSLSADRPERPVIFISTARMAPARHQPQLAAQIRAGGTGAETKPLLENYLKRLRDVLEKPYRAAGWQGSAGVGLAICETSASYSGFNMSFAEENLIEIFRQIQTAGTGSLVIIEDIDAGLHPAMCERLARNLVEMCREKSLQIILSARSPEFLDALPRTFRTLVEFDGSRHYVEDNVPMRRVLRAIGASAPADVLIFCEDDIAEAIIVQTVDGELRRRMKVVRAGAKSSLAQFAYSHYRSGWSYKILIVWDGDVQESEAAAWLRGLNMTHAEQQALSRIQLPGPLPPERWLIDQLLQHDGAALLAEELGEDAREAQMMLNAATARAQHHNIFYELARKSALDKAHVLNSAIRATRRLPHRPLTHLGEQMRRVAAGESLIDIGKLHEGAA